MQNSEFAYFSSESGKHMKQMSNPPFWGDVSVKKWSSFLDSGARSPIFGHLKMGTFNFFFFGTGYWPCLLMKAIHRWARWVECFVK